MRVLTDGYGILNPVVIDYPPIKHVFITCTELHEAIKNENPLIAWRIDLWINVVKNYRISVGVGCR